MQAGAPSRPIPTDLPPVCTAAPAAMQRATAGASAAHHTQSSGMTVLAATAATQQLLAAGAPAPQRKAQRSGGQLSGAPASPGRSASPRSATSMAYLGQPGTLAPSRPHHQQHSPLAKAPQEWEGDATSFMQEVHTPCCRSHSPLSRVVSLSGRRIGSSFDSRILPRRLPRC